MKKFLCVVTVTLLIAGLYGCGKGDDNLSADQTAVSEESAAISDESSEVSDESSAISDISENNSESDISAPDDGRVEELEEEIENLKSLLSTAENGKTEMQNRIKDLEKQIDDLTSQVTKAIVNVFYMKGGSRLLLTRSGFNYRLTVEYADKTTQEILNDYYISIIKPSPDGSKLVFNNFQMECTAQVYLYDDGTHTTRELQMPLLPQSRTAAFMEWLDDRYFLFVVQLDHGSVVRGGDVYFYDTQTDDYGKIIEMKDPHQQIYSFNVYSDAFIIFNAIEYEETYNFTEDVYFSVTVDEIRNLISGKNTMILKPEDEI